NRDWLDRLFTFIQPPVQFGGDALEFLETSLLTGSSDEEAENRLSEANERSGGGDVGEAGEVANVRRMPPDAGPRAVAGKHQMFAREEDGFSDNRSLVRR